MSKWWWALGPGVYEGDEFFGVMMTDELAQRVAKGLNLLDCAPEACHCNNPETSHVRGDAGFCQEAGAGK